MHRFTSILILSALLSACDQPMATCDSLIGDDPQFCANHPFGRAPYCGGIEEPATEANCDVVLTKNPGLCSEDILACREAIRVAACDMCPPECEGVEGACDL